MTETLDELVNKRKTTAISNGLFEKARDIAVAFGRISSKEELGIARYAERKLLKKRFEVIYFRTVEYCGVVLDDREGVKFVSNGNQVFAGSRQFEPNKSASIIAYVPGEWEGHFSDLYLQAEAALDRREKAENERKEAKLRESFGL